MNKLLISCEIPYPLIDRVQICARPSRVDSSNEPANNDTCPCFVNSVIINPFVELSFDYSSGNHLAEQLR